MSEIRYEIKQHIATLSENEGYTKEVNIISWNGGEKKIDIRAWKNGESEKQPLKGITLTCGEVMALKVALATVNDTQM